MLSLVYTTRHRDVLGASPHPLHTVPPPRNNLPTHVRRDTVSLPMNSIDYNPPSTSEPSPTLSHLHPCPFICSTSLATRSCCPAAECTLARGRGSSALRGRTPPSCLLVPSRHNSYGRRKKRSRFSLASRDVRYCEYGSDGIRHSH